MLGWLKKIIKKKEEIYEPWLCQECGVREVVIACPDHCQECEDKSRAKRRQSKNKIP